ncbi:MAG TPA: glucosyl-3-phosphoglycerate synthase [Actinomycetales bacterium]|nr:glucosyl-3-phosphoglycerate synthase [Actinomycetales bacterium]
MRTCAASDWTVEELLAAKAAGGHSVSMVLPARNEEATVGRVARALLPLVDAGLVDDLLVIDSLSDDDTLAAASAAGARVVTCAEALPDVEPMRGKGEAMWRSLFATSGDIVAFCDADLLDAGAHYGVGLLGPLLTDPDTLLVKGFYDRPLVDDQGSVTGYGGRVTELVARPLLNLHWPELAGLVQPLAGEWAGRRSLLESLPFPVGYGVEIGVLLDTLTQHGSQVITQVDLGRRTHLQQSQDALGVMAAEVMATALRRLDVTVTGKTLTQFISDASGRREVTTPVPLLERPPAQSMPRSAGQPPR